MQRLELLSTFHRPDTERAADEVQKEVQKHCRRIVELMGPRSFHVGSTVRQFKRYTDAWKDELWRQLAEEAINILEPDKDVDYDWPDDYSS